MCRIFYLTKGMYYLTFAAWFDKRVKLPVQTNCDQRTLVAIISLKCKTSTFSNIKHAIQVIVTFRGQKSCDLIG